MSADYYAKGELRFLAGLKLPWPYSDLVDRYRSARPQQVDMERVLEILLPYRTEHELVRLGGNGDGAYLVPNDLRGMQACFSPGVNNFKRFEDDLVNYQIRSHMCDGSSDVERLQTPLVEGAQTFRKVWLEPSASENAVTLTDWIAELEPHTSELLLQMDIEGAEYRNLLMLPDRVLERFRIVVIEFHGLDWIGWSNMFLRAILLPVLERLDKSHMVLHVHPNNVTGAINIFNDVFMPKLLEVTFLRRDRVGQILGKAQLPHPLDIRNVSNRPPLRLGKPWSSAISSSFHQTSASPSAGG